ncbi:hypothetical protein MCOR02_002817 [Pyricularia oryzae]|uniref:Uncharacterized protein n=1 Tax=Pyricularia oryzae TaxID=318829 RepID=A0A4P7N326_PYROR|nr:hypothetical protein MCOR02_002817 [Pyricularia oryzae]KAI6255888.1 hypothetical protein MCOR19_007628 [Pyricularia oryzae]KAI6310363.1 hypothetical protein MCOR34_006412 [Pyricularia oryzae]KAI6312518.1 hypothetical protein MCOR29_007990 [Pyricularia oryzae]KAI6321075.1 hypothetical protein MCOR30_008095 [Pyricularia oryzae]
MGPRESSSHVRRCQQVSGFPQLDVPQSTRGQDIGVETLQRPAHSQHTWYGMILAVLGQMPNEVEDPLQSCRNPLSRRDTNYSTQEMLPWQHRLAATIHSFELELIPEISEGRHYPGEATLLLQYPQ